MSSRLLNLVSIIAAIIFIGSGCANSAHIEKVTGADLSRYKTYGWLDAEPANKNNEKYKMDVATQTIRAAVGKALQKSGWKYNAEKPDVLVSTDWVVEKTEKQLQDPVYSQPFTRTFYNRYTRRLNSFYYPSRFMGYEQYATTVKEGTVTVTLIDAATDKAVWQGWSTDELDHTNLSSKVIDRNVASIFRKFETNSD